MALSKISSVVLIIGGERMKMRYSLAIGDSLTELKKMADQSVQCWVTSPPYWGLRDYGVDGQIGLEKTPDEYVTKMVEIFREARRVLRDDGTLWLNLGDSYCGNRSYQVSDSKHKHHVFGVSNALGIQDGYKCKDIVGIPWMVAFALRSDGWYLRQDIIWSKPNPMPESVKDRCTKSHEYLFLLSKSGRYYYDQEAIREPCQHPNQLYKSQKTSTAQTNAYHGRPPSNIGRCGTKDDYKINKRSVWTITTKPFPQAHFATFPPALVEPCILAGCPEGGVVGDMFAGSGTTGVVALKHFRRFVGIELNPVYAKDIAIPRLESEANRFKQEPLF